MRCTPLPGSRSRDTSGPTAPFARVTLLARLALVACAMSVASGCQLIVRFDDSKIPAADADGGTPDDAVEMPDGNTDDVPAVDGATNDVPGTDGGMDAPTTDVPGSDVPGTDTPVVDVPVVDVPVADVPIVDVNEPDAESDAADDA